MAFELPDVPSTILDSVESPSVLVFEDRVRQNIKEMIRVAGGVERLRPHCKTHKMTAVIQLLLDAGIVRHKAATVAEAEMLATAGVKDVALAYNPVGPNIPRVVALVQKFPETDFSVTADHPGPLTRLARAAADAGVSVGVLMDINVGQNRTGISPDSNEAVELYSLIGSSDGVTCVGFHVYDGHQHQSSAAERTEAVMKEWPRVLALREQCESSGNPVQELVCGGTPTFPVYAGIDTPGVSLSPGTSIFHDAGYGSSFPDLQFVPAAGLVTRVISRPSSNRVTLDLGNKAVAADPPNGRRVHFPTLPDAVHVLHNEEHLVLETDLAADYSPGDVLLGVPVHVCPTSALHQSVSVLNGEGNLSTWDVTARNRKISV